jgi:hypothetical protein
MKLVMSLLAFAGLSIWLTKLAKDARAKQPQDFVHVEKLKTFRQYEAQITEDARRRLALCAERRRVS